MLSGVRQPEKPNALYRVVGGKKSKIFWAFFNS